MGRISIPTCFFVLVAVRRQDRFLVVHETKHGQLWFLPAGRVEPGETFAEAAERETLEEAGIPVEVQGVIRLEHTPDIGGMARLRVFFLAHPRDDAPLKTTPDDESLEARWVTLEEAEALPLRNQEVTDIFRYLAEGGPVYPRELIAQEGSFGG